MTSEEVVMECRKLGYQTNTLVLVLVRNQEICRWLGATYDRSALTDMIARWSRRYRRNELVTYQIIGPKLRCLNESKPSQIANLIGD
jgi:hypothetical protein